jgi:RNA polymerase-associated protein CTR9
LEYFRLGRGEDFKVILEESQKLESEISDVRNELPRVISALAWYHVMACSSANARSGGKDAREDLLFETNKWLNRAVRGDFIENPLVSATMAMAKFWSGDGRESVEKLLDSLSPKEHNVATLSLRAMMHFNDGEYAEALSQFARILRSKPDCPASVRFGLGLCYFKLDRRDMAEKCFERALQLDDQLIEPRVALAAMKLNTGDLAQVQPAMRLLSEAYKIDDNHPRVLVLFADHYFHRRDFDKLHKLAVRARENTDVRRILSEVLFQLGRSEHARGEFEKAHMLYESSVAEDGDNSLAQFGLAQVLLHEGDAMRAIECLDAVLRRSPDDLSTLHTMGIVLARQGRSEEAKELLQRAVDADTGMVGPDTFLEFGQLMEKTDRAKSLAAYRAALKLLLERGKPEQRDRILGVQNNVAVMHHRLGQLAAAEAVYKDMFGAETLQDAEACVSKSVTMSFNLARLLEDLGKLDEAQALHEAILRKHVSYTDSYLRLAWIARAQKRSDDAMKHLADALAVHEDLPDALTMMGNLHIERHELHAAQLKFTRVLEKVDRDDAYSLLSLGNIYYMARAEKKERKERNIKHAAESYWKVLHADPANLYAANGLGVVMAAEGRLGAAAEFFTRVREGTGAMGDVVVNLAHIHMAKGDFHKAVTLYESALRKHFKNSHPKILLYLSRAYFEAKDFVKSEEYLKRCLDVAEAKNDQALRFNLGLILETKSRHFLDRVETPLIDPARTALSDVERARAVFFEIVQQGEAMVALQQDEPGGASQQDDAGEDEAAAAASRKARLARQSETLKSSREHVISCDELIKIAEMKLQKAQAFLMDEETIRKQREERAQERLRAKLEAEERRREAERAGAAELAAIAEKDMLVLREEMVHWKPLSSGGGGSGRKAERDGGGGGGGGGRDGGDSERKPKKKKEKRSKEIADELADLTPSVKKQAKVERAPSTSTISQEVQQEQEEEEEEDELEEWQKARMNPKLSSLVESKRVRDEREKRGHGSKRRNVDADPAE